MPSDKEYKATKQIMLGNSIMNPDFNELANFINQTFGVKTINIIYDIIDNEKRPRLNICFEFEWEKQSFNENNGQYNFDAEKQKLITDKFRQILKEQKNVKEKGLFDFFTKPKNEKYKTNDVWIYYSAFEPIARIEANENVPQAKVVQLKEKLNNKDIWEISRCFSGTTFFVYTDQQIKEYENSPSQRIWADRYFDLLEPYNEFGYFKRDNFSVYVDSKENFDTNYQSNWYYYYK
jgi:hypothetical protein